MARIDYDRRGRPLDAMAADYARPCTLCGGDRGRTAAYWVGVEEIYICLCCAVDYLPKLIADAVASVHIPTGTPVHVRYEEKILREYWRAAALALGRLPASCQAGREVLEGDDAAEGR
jgi:hypothetical protein